MATQAPDKINPATIPLDQINLADPGLFQRNEHWPFFERLRKEDPVHYTPDSEYGPFWSVTKYNDIVAVDSNYKVFSSHNALTLDEERYEGTGEDGVAVGGFIAMDPPKHDEHRKIVTPAVAPANIARIEGLIRERTRDLLKSLPVGEEFDWVPAVSIELTTLMLATLFDFPMDERHNLKYWSDLIAGIPGDGVVESWEQRDEGLQIMAQTFLKLKEERAKMPPQPDFISILAHSPLAQDMSPVDYVANVSLLIVGGNDTTRNTMSGTVYAMHTHPDQWEKLKANPELVDSMVPEAIRFQTPVIYQGRRATEDTELGGKTIRKGDKVLMWYISGNRDDETIENPDKFIIDRKRPRQHLSFGFGVHRCLGNRLAEMQLRVLWEEILKMGWSRIECVSEPKYAYSLALRGIDSLMVRIHA